MNRPRGETAGKEGQEPRIARYVERIALLDEPTTPGRRRSAAALSPEQRNQLTHIPNALGPDVAVLLRWQLGFGSAMFDGGGFFELARLAQLPPERVTIAIECAGPPIPLDTTGRRTQGRTADALERLDELCFRIERAWEGEWSDVEPRRRPGLVIVRPDGAVAIGAAILPELRPGLRAVATAPLITAADFRAAVTAANRPASASSDMSRAFAVLRRQGLLHLAAEAAARRYEHHVRRVREPYKVHLSPVHAALERARRDSSAPVQPAPGSDAENHSWFLLTERLRARGLRTV